MASILVRFFSRFKALRGICNPYYGICIPSKLKPLWIHLEFWSLLPHVFVRALLRRLCKFLVCDRGFLDFIVWIIITLEYPGFLNTIYGRFLLRLALKERPIYLHAGLETLVKRADVPREFLVKELTIYSVLATYIARCDIDTGVKSPWEALRDVLKRLED